jgi:hypothetical protein
MREILMEARDLFRVRDEAFDWVKGWNAVDWAAVWVDVCWVLRMFLWSVSQSEIGCAALWVDACWGTPGSPSECVTGDGMSYPSTLARGVVVGNPGVGAGVG